jgi:hypothetical protein
MKKLQTLCVGPKIQRMEPLQPRWVVKLGGKKILKAPKMVVGTSF